MTDQYLPRNINNTVVGDALEAFLNVDGTISSNAAAVEIVNTGGDAQITVTLPSAAEYVGRSLLWFNVLAGAGLDTANLAAASNETVAGLPSLSLARNSVAEFFSFVRLRCADRINLPFAST